MEFDRRRVFISNGNVWHSANPFRFPAFREDGVLPDTAVIADFPVEPAPVMNEKHFYPERARDDRARYRHPASSAGGEKAISVIRDPLRARRRGTTELLLQKILDRW
jgi:hypothetical protein